MTSWRGFVRESKSYMNHPDYWMEAKAQLYLADGTPDHNYPGWTDKDRFDAILNFWRKFPRAWLRFHWLVFRDWIKKTYREFIND